MSSSTSLKSTWQEYRSAFNHDWLKNKYLYGLNTLIDRLQAERIDAERLREYLEDRFPAWETQKDQLQQLVNVFESEMSPLHLFETPPLSNCDEATKAWLGDLAQGLWYVRHPEQTRIQDVEEAFNKADTLYEELRSALGDSTVMVGAQLVKLLPTFQAFRDACAELSRRISRLPSQIQVT